MTSKTSPAGDPVARAYSAWFAWCAATGAIADQPANTSGIVTHDGREYVVLENVRGTLAVYRITTTGQLKRLRRWPSEVAAA